MKLTRNGTIRKLWYGCSYSHSIATMAISLAVSTQYTNVIDTHPARNCKTAAAALCSLVSLQSSGKNHRQDTRPISRVCDPRFCCHHITLLGDRAGNAVQEICQRFLCSCAWTGSGTRFNTNVCQS